MRGGSSGDGQRSTRTCVCEWEIDNKARQANGTDLATVGESNCCGGGTLNDYTATVA